MQTRRQIVIAGAALTLTGFQRHDVPKEIPPKDIILVHGTWHGGWCWDFVKPLLQAKGYRVYAPDLTGLGQKADLLGPDVGLQTHIDDVNQIIDTHSLNNVILLGHSYGGIVITGAAGQRQDHKIQHLIYLDALIPEAGQKLTNIDSERSEEDVAEIETQIRALAPDGYGMTPPDPEVFGIPEDHPKRDWVAERLTPHPLQTWLDPIPSVPGKWPRRTFIYCTDPALPSGSISKSAENAKTCSDWGYYEIATGHDAMITEPDLLAEIIHQAIL